MKLAIDSAAGDQRTKLMLLNPEVKLETLDIEKLEKLGISNNILYKELTIG